jgi:hypothetical protein
MHTRMHIYEAVSKPAQTMWDMHVKNQTEGILLKILPSILHPFSSIVQALER